MEYTISQIAQLSGISNRTIRYYDEIGLLKPAKINESGYRIYGEAEVDILQQIIFYRELDVSLDSILRIINEPTFDEIQVLSDHINQLIQRRDRLDKIIATVEKTIAHKKGDLIMSTEEKFEGLKDQIIQDNETHYGEEIRRKYGDTEINQSNKLFKNMSETDYQAYSQLENEIIELLKDAKQTEDISSEKAQQLVAKHQAWLKYVLPNYSPELHVSIAEMYVADERFSTYYDKHIEDGAQFLRDAIMNYLKQ